MKHILLVDDDPTIVKYMKNVLEKKGYAAHAINNPIQVAAFMKEHSMDLVLLDVDMPEKSGLEVFDELKMVYQEFPVLFVTGHPEQFDVDTQEKLDRWQVGFADGLTDILGKPFEVQDLYDKVEALIGQAVEIG